MTTSDASAPRRVVFIMTDTQRCDMLGCYGNAAMHTPNLDALAAGGMRFEKAYTCQPVCGPARSAIFTGQYPHSNGAWGNSMTLGDNVKTVGQRLTDAGVHCAYIGKWHLDGGDYFGTGRCPEGWDDDYWYDMRRYLDELTPQQRRQSRRMASNAEGWVTEEFTFAHRCSDRAIRFLDAAADDEDFLLVVSYDEPHGPFLCPPKYRELYADYAWPLSPAHADTLETKPEYQRAWRGGPYQPIEQIKRPSLADFLGCNSFVDSEIGRVIDTVREKAPDALILYTSDHGDAIAAHGLGGKGPCVYDEIARVPFIASGPGVAAATVNQNPMSHIHIVPTILEHFHQPVPKLLEGASAATALADPTVAASDKVFIEFGRYEIDHDGFGGLQPMRACFDGRYKLALHLLDSDELYDTLEDPSNLVNLIDSPEHAAIRNELHDAILDWMNETRDPFRGYCWHRRPWRSDAPPATWAYTGMTRQRENEEYEPRQLDYDTGQEMTEATRKKF